RALDSFPTRRSSDLSSGLGRRPLKAVTAVRICSGVRWGPASRSRCGARSNSQAVCAAGPPTAPSATDSSGCISSFLSQTELSASRASAGDGVRDPLRVRGGLDVGHDELEHEADRDDAYIRYERKE